MRIFEIDYDNSRPIFITLLIKVNIDNNFTFCGLLIRTLCLAVA